MGLAEVASGQRALGEVGCREDSAGALGAVALEAPTAVLGAAVQGAVAKGGAEWGV